MAFSDSSWQDCTDTEEVQEHTLFSIKVDQLTMVHMFQDQLDNPVQKVSTMQHELQECLSTF